MKYNNRLQELRGNISQGKFAEPLGLTQQNYGNYERGEQKLNSDLIVKICTTYGCTAEWLLGLDDQPRKGLAVTSSDEDFVDVPVYGSIAAGTPIEMIEALEYFPVPRIIVEKYGGFDEDGKPVAFLLRINGESMNRILPNGVLSMQVPCTTIDHDNDPYAICVNGYEATVKRVHKLNNGFELRPDSTDPTFKPQIFDYGVEGTETITPIAHTVHYFLPLDWRL